MGRGRTRVLIDGPLWDDEPWPSLPRLSGHRRADVCIVGLGGTGLTAAHEALALGATVVAIDASTVGGGAAGRNGGFLLAGAADPHHLAVARLGHERAVALYRATLEEMDPMEATTPDAVWRNGSVRVSESADEDEDLSRQAAALVADGFLVERLHVDGRSALRFPQDGSLQPLRRCRSLARSAMRRGAELYERSRVTEVGAERVVTEAGSISASAVLVAVDGGLERVIPELAPRVRTARLQMLATEPTAEVSIACPVYSRWGFDYWQQLPSGAVVVGGLRDQHDADEWGADDRPSEAVQQGLERLLRERIGIRSAAITHRWAGTVAFTADHLPIFEEVAEGVVAVGAYSGTGNVIGAMCGRTAVHHLLGHHSDLKALLWSGEPT